ncbi:MAG: cobalamin-dependent protein, partial [Eggerthellaceae bacterium]|nr:cobalamin-dependent protein [Eggerthellaceae bacterium]
GTVLGDKHDIGKNLVRIMMESRDIEVADLGIQVPPEAFVEHVRNNAKCNLVLISVSRTDLLENVRDTIKALKKAKLRDQVFVMIGGAAASQEFADEIGADAFTVSAEDAAAKAHELMSL